MAEKKIGLVFGKFYPLHTGHIYLIQRACNQADELHVILIHDELRDRALFEKSSMRHYPTGNDRLRWLLQTFKYQKHIYVHSFNEQRIEADPYCGGLWIKALKTFMAEKSITPSFIYSSELQDIQYYRKYLGIDTILIDPKRTFMNIRTSQIRQHPFCYWDYIATEAKPFFVLTVAILGGESSGKSTLINQLTNIFNTTYASEYGREYVFSHLGGNETSLQYSDYDKIALGQAKYVNCAVKHANKVAFIDTDFITTQAFCKKYEGREHPFVQALINQYHFDLVILLENNTPWVADGLRRLGDSAERRGFQHLLETMLHANNISYVHIQSSDYEKRFLHCVDLVKQLLVIP
ncbi:Trifunctional NAD biosynthesis/regulator proteinNadR [Serratia symbiotica]|nr:Trifunctional NAD biosynthesis/regulator proteinNadR [Serratia symbiotica]